MTIQTKIEKNSEKKQISKKDKKNAQMREQRKNNLEKLKDNMKKKLMQNDKRCIHIISKYINYMFFHHKSTYIITCFV